MEKIRNKNGMLTPRMLPCKITIFNRPVALSAKRVMLAGRLCISCLVSFRGCLLPFGHLDPAIAILPLFLFFSS